MMERRSFPPRVGGRSVALLVILIASVCVAVLYAWLAAEPARTREIHIEAFRYGFSPSRIHVNRGDRLRLTFSTRDTGQSFFLQDYDLNVVITPGSDIVEVHTLSRSEDPPSRMRVVEVTAGLPSWWGALASKSQFRNHTYNGPLHGTERGDLVVAPNYLLHGSLGLLCGIGFAGFSFWARRRPETPSRHINLFQPFPWLKRLLRKPSIQFNLTLPMLAVFYFVILAGFIGTKVSGRNAGPMVIWVLWLSILMILLVPLGGRIWCLICPLPSLGEWLQRHRMSRDEASQPRWSWPVALSGASPRVLFFLLLGTFSTALVAIPSATSWLLTGLVSAAILTAWFREQRVFCRYLCPVNSFISLYSTTGRLAVRPVSADVCSRCGEHFCRTGSARGWGCPYGLCAGEVQRNNDCGMCAECVKTCAYDNVAFFWRTAGWDRDITTHGEAFQGIAMFGLAAIYAVVNLGSWHQVRDWIDIVDKGNWRTFWIYGAVVWTACLGVLPLLAYLLTRLGIALGRSRMQAGIMFRTSSAAFVPLGLSCWIAFAIALLLSMMTFVLQSLSDPFNWGWDLLGRAGSQWYIPLAPAIPWIQVACVITGVLYSLRTLRLCWDGGADRSAPVTARLPLASFLWLSAAGMIWFFAG
jgi:polyferredoxin